MKPKKKIPMVLQHERSECGYACIAMVASYFGCEMDISQLRGRFGSFAQGMSLYDIRSVLSSLNFTAQALWVALENLTHLSCPVILHWNLDHFVLLTKIHRHRYWIHDPAIGVQIYSLQEISNAYTGVTLLVTPTEKMTPIKQTKRLTLTQLFFSLLKSKSSFYLMLGLSLLVECGQIMQALLMQYVTDVVVGMQAWSNMLMVSIGLGGILTLLLILSYGRDRLNLWMGVQLKTQFSLNAMRHLLSLPMAYFERRQVGQLQLTFHAVEEVQRKLGGDWVQGVTELVFVGINFIVMGVYSVILTSVVTVSAAIAFLVQYLNYQAMHHQRQLAFNAQGRASSIFLDIVQTLLPMKVYGKEAARWTQWRHQYIQAVNAETEGALIQLNYQIGLQFVSQLEYVLLVIIGAYLIGQDVFSLGMLVAFLAYRQAFATKLSCLLHRLLAYQLMEVELERLKDFVSQSPENVGAAIGKPQPCRGELTVSSASFAYEGARSPVLSNISLTVSPGEKLVICGPSGAGKSTLLKMMMGLLMPQQGEISVEGRTLSEIGLSVFRQWTASVLQEDRLMSGTLRENIVFFEEQAEDAWLEEIIHLVDLTEWIKSLPMGLDMCLSEMGANLSGGQKQRLLLARALYKRPVFLFLDEATSHLDPATEVRVNRALKQLSMTQIIVAHRQETVALADRVITLQGGSILC